MKTITLTAAELKLVTEALKYTKNEVAVRARWERPGSTEKGRKLKRARRFEKLIGKVSK